MALDHVVPQNDAEFPPCCVWRCIPADAADWCCCCGCCCSSWAETTGDIDDDSVDATVSASSRDKQLLLLRLLFFFRATIIIAVNYSFILLSCWLLHQQPSPLDICNDWWQLFFNLQSIKRFNKNQSSPSLHPPPLACLPSPIRGRYLEMVIVLINGY